MDRRDRSRKAASATASMAALAAAAAAGEGADAGVVTHVDEDKKPALNLAVDAAGASHSSMSPTAAVPVSTRRGGAAAVASAVVGGNGGPSCQAERCGADMTDAKRYHRRHKVCEAHAKAPVVIVAGLRQRFCQQCSRFHELSEFDDIKRSCRRRLAGHNERRRKSAADPHGGGGTSAGDGCRHDADHDGRGHPGNPPPSNFQIR